MSGHPGQQRGWRGPMQTGATNLLNIDLQRDGMHNIAPCSSLCYKHSRDDHARRSHERSPWGELRSLELSFCRVSFLKAAICVTLRFSIFFQSIPASLCSLSSVLGGLLPFECVLTVLAPKAGFLLRQPLRFFLVGRQVFRKRKNVHGAYRMVDFLTEFCLFLPKSLTLPASLIVFWSFRARSRIFVEILIS